MFARVAQLRHLGNRLSFHPVALRRSQGRGIDPHSDSGRCSVCGEFLFLLFKIQKYAVLEEAAQQTGITVYQGGEGHATHGAGSRWMSLAHLCFFLEQWQI